MIDSINLNEDEYKMKHAVDIPKHPMNWEVEGEWENVEYFETYEEALHYTQETFGADDEGKISIISSI